MSKVAKKAERRLREFETILSEYDHEGVEQVKDGIAESSIARTRVPDLGPDEWMDVLEVVSDDLYLHAHDSDRTGFGDEWDVTWYLRHDGDEFIYGTEKTGELYRGEDAERQIRAVVEGQKVYPHMMDSYPLEAEK